MMKKLITLFTCLLLTIGVSAQHLTPQRGTVKDAYNFWLYTPDANIDSEDEPKPVIIFLHGASLCGNNLDKVRRYGTIDAIEKGRKLDAYVIAPQNPGGAWNPHKVMNIVDWLGDNHNIDYDRIYVLGMSLGGYGTIDLAATYPDRIAAAMAMCGGGSVKDLSGLNDVPLWIIHGTADRAVSIGQSDKVVSQMKAHDSSTPRLIYNRIPGMNHSQPARLFYLSESYDWLFSHSLKDKKRSVSKGFDLTGGIMRSAYKDLKSSGKKRSTVSRATKKKKSTSRKSRKSRRS